MSDPNRRTFLAGLLATAAAVKMPAPAAAEDYTVVYFSRDREGIMSVLQAVTCEGQIYPGTIGRWCGIDFVESHR